MPTDPAEMRPRCPIARVGTTRSGRSKAAGRELDLGAADAAIAQRRAAGGAEIALGDRWTIGTPPACRGSRRNPRGRRRRSEANGAAGRPSGTSGSGRCWAVAGFCIEGVAHGTALAAAGQNGFCCRSSCSLHPPPGFPQRRQRVAAGEDEIADARGAQRRLPARRDGLPDRQNARRPLDQRGGGVLGDVSVNRVGRAQTGEVGAGGPSTRRPMQSRFLKPSVSIVSMPPASKKLLANWARGVKSAAVPRLARKIRRAVARMFSGCRRTCHGALQTARRDAAVSAR